MAAVLVNTQPPIEGALLSPPGIPAPTAALSFNPVTALYGKGMPALPPWPLLARWPGTY